MRRPGAAFVAALIPALFVAYAWLVFRTSWLSEDAFITLRTCDNALAGYGLRWNIAERVQTYTHPLWMLVLLVTHAVTGEPFYGTQYVSIFVSCAAVATLLIGTKGGVFERALALCLLLLSKSFVEYSTSGLENPLTHFWIACFVVLYLREPSPARLRGLGIVMGLAALSRLDTVLLFAPAWAARGISHRRDEALRSFALAAVPLVAWLAFSVVYYGFPWPNTAYAKLAVGDMAGAQRLLEAYRYFLISSKADPITLAAWFAIVVLMLARRDRTRLALLSGSALSLAYVVAIGGDFMAGRFFSAPCFMAVACLASSHALQEKRTRSVAVALAALLAALGDHPPLFTGYDFGQDRPVKTDHGIWDSRAEFFQHTSLARASTITPESTSHPWSGLGHVLRAAAQNDPAARVQFVTAMGFAGYYGGPQLHVVDHWALADPLLARLPAAFGGIGHYTRPIPEGYPATLASGRNQIRDPTLAEYYDQLALVTRGELFSRERWRAIWQLNTGAYRDRLRRALYVDAEAVTARLRLTNIGSRPEVMAYVWNDFQRVECLLDTGSANGRQYEISWRIDADGPTLLSPEVAPRIAGIERLAPAGMFTLSVAFRSSPADGDMDIYELQFHYVLEGRRLRFLREPVRVHVPRVPLEHFRSEAVLPAIELLELRTE